MPPLGEMQTPEVSVYGVSLSWGAVLLALAVCQFLLGGGFPAAVNFVLSASCAEAEQPSVVWRRQRRTR